jgi:osmoprotectant transport system substrate-binding protein
VAELCSTQPDILVNGWVVLTDDKNTQPADNVAPIVRNDYLAKVDKASFEKLLNDVSAQIDTATLAELYKEVSVDKKDPKDVAATWLKSKGFVK